MSSEPGVWTATDAKARFSELLDRCRDEGPQVLRRRGENEAVVLRFSDWEALKSGARRRTLKDLLLAPTPRFDVDWPDRSELWGRKRSGRARRVRYCLDTNVISELRRVRPHGGVVAWLQTVPPENLFLPAPVLGELQSGVQRVVQSNPERAHELQQWLDDVHWTSSVVDMTGEDFRRHAILMHGQNPALRADAMIAVIAARCSALWRPGMSRTSRLSSEGL